LPDALGKGYTNAPDASEPYIQSTFREYQAGTITAEIVFERLFPLLYGPLVAFLGRAYKFQPSDRDEVFQETMLKVLGYKRRSKKPVVPQDCKYDPSLPFTPWIYAVTANEAKRFLRSKYRRANLLKAHEEDEKQHLYLSPQRPPDLKDTINAFAELVSGLPKETRKLLWLKYAEELTDEELAYFFQQPLSAIKARLRRAKTKLRKLLSRSKPPDDPSGGGYSSGSRPPTAPMVDRMLFSKPKERKCDVMSSDSEIHRLFRELRTRDIAEISQSRQTRALDRLKKLVASHNNPLSERSGSVDHNLEGPKCDGLTKKQSKTIILISFLITTLSLVARAVIWRPAVAQAATTLILISLSVDNISISTVPATSAQYSERIQVPVDYDHGSGLYHSADDVLGAALLNLESVTLSGNFNTSDLSINLVLDYGLIPDKNSNTVNTATYVETPMICACDALGDQMIVKYLAYSYRDFSSGASAVTNKEEGLNNNTSLITDNVVTEITNITNNSGGSGLIFVDTTYVMQMPSAVAAEQSMLLSVMVTLLVLILFRPHCRATDGSSLLVKK